MKSAYELAMERLKAAEPDVAPLTADQVLGKVYARECKGHRRAVVGGARGRRRAAFLHVVAFLRWLLLSALAPFYDLVRISRAGRLLWRPRIAIVHFMLPAGRITKYIHRGKTVASWAVPEKRWSCCRPYDLVLAPPIR